MGVYPCYLPLYAVAVFFATDIFIHCLILALFQAQQLHSETNCTEAATTLTDALQDVKEDSELALFASQWIEHTDGSLMQDIDFDASIYYFTDLPQRPLASAWLKIACTLAEEGASLFCSQPEGIMNTVWTVAVDRQLNCSASFNCLESLITRLLSRPSTSWKGFFTKIIFRKQSLILYSLSFPLSETSSSSILCFRAIILTNLFLS